MWILFLLHSLYYYLISFISYRLQSYLSCVQLISVIGLLFSVKKCKSGRKVTSWPSHQGPKFNHSGGFHTLQYFCIKTLINKNFTSSSMKKPYFQEKCCLTGTLGSFFRILFHQLSLSLFIPSTINFITPSYKYAQVTFMLK